MVQTLVFHLSYIYCLRLPISVGPQLSIFLCTKQDHLEGNLYHWSQLIVQTLLNTLLFPNGFLRIEERTLSKVYVLSTSHSTNVTSNSYEQHYSHIWFPIHNSVIFLLFLTPTGLELRVWFVYKNNFILCWFKILLEFIWNMELL